MEQIWSQTGVVGAGASAWRCGCETKYLSMMEHPKEGEAWEGEGDRVWRV